MDVDYPESFGSIKTSHAVAEIERICATSASRCVVEICVSFLAVVPVLESSSDEPTRDKELTDLVLDCSPEFFFFVAPVFFSNVQRRILKLTPNNLKRFLDKFSSVVTGSYTFGRREMVLLLLVFFMQSTLPVWLHENVRATDVGKNVGDFLEWLSQLIKKNSARSWKVRDAIARFLDDYLSHDPSQGFWNSEQDLSQNTNPVPPDSLPSALLPLMAEDDDIRVRFRVASLNSRLFSIAQPVDVDPMVLYSSVLKHLTKNIDE
jgi:ataxia telangiectasia mutated family protein